MADLKDDFHQLGITGAQQHPYLKKQNLYIIIEYLKKAVGKEVEIK